MSAQLHGVLAAFTLAVMVGAFLVGLVLLLGILRGDFPEGSDLR